MRYSSRSLGSGPSCSAESFNIQDIVFVVTIHDAGSLKFVLTVVLHEILGFLLGVTSANFSLAARYT